MSAFTNLKIRPALPADTAIVAEYNCRLASETENLQLDLDRVNQGVGALIADPAKGTYYVAEVEGRVAGQLLITYEWSDWRNGNFWWIQSVYVTAEYRGRGIYKALYRHLHELAQQRGDVCGLRLYVEQANQSAQQTYQRLGMNKTHYDIYEVDFVLGR